MIWYFLYSVLYYIYICYIIYTIKYYIYHIYISIITNVNIVNKLSNKPETFPPGTPFNSTEFLSRATVTTDGSCRLFSSGISTYTNMLRLLRKGGVWNQALNIWDISCIIDLMERNSDQEFQGCSNLL